MQLREVKWGKPEYHDFKQLYLTAFPGWERFPVIALTMMAWHKNVHYMALYDQNKFCGLAYYVEGETVIYLTYLAINDQLRGQGYGTKILTFLKNEFASKEIILDIEPVVAEAENYQQRLSRLRFYERNGFKQTQYDLVEKRGHTQVMSTSSEFDPVIMTRILRQMSFGLYRFTVEHR
ncbi:GNAT family N-acetyltransferase [Lactobacillus sp. ESL0684]|uniref:GNAT family N-acetyltransferase n=1 Tax=Lactobacillus sp. ESL0684 TaxID=2983213 RepID=UPI0023FA3D69|nr:GNAT family N-acetyltransferase [Lactobacillus sp. ESL0684]WEV43183.1 GNAT family N-acetyltransferase [Lactobacillus sp. ESL0684]